MKTGLKAIKTPEAERVEKYSAKLESIKNLGVVGFIENEGFEITNVHAQALQSLRWVDYLQQARAMTTPGCDISRNANLGLKKLMEDRESCLRD